MLRTRLKNNIIDYNLLLPHDSVIVAVSAGPDSIALLCLLHQIEFHLSPIAVYIDHGLRPKEVTIEIDYVKNLAEQLHIPSEIVRVNVHKFRKKHRTSVEEAARILRYEALEKCRLKYRASAIAVAHTADDQAEQILLRLIRGTGLRGLSGMRVQNNNIIRPLLGEHKVDLIKYLEESKIPYCYDSSNSEVNFLRNRVRLNLLPFLEKNFNPSIRTNLLQTVNILQKDEDFLRGLAETGFRESVNYNSENTTKSAPLTLDIKNFLQTHEAIRRRILEKICLKLDINPSFRQITQLDRLAEHGKNGSELHLPTGLRVIKNERKLLFTRPFGKQRIRGNFCHLPLKAVSVDKEGLYAVNNLEMVLELHYLTKKPEILRDGSLLLDGEKVALPLILRSPEPGERFIPQGMRNRKKISRFLSDLKIPRHARHLHPVLVSGKNIVAVVGLRIDQRYVVKENTTHFLQINWIPSSS